MILCLLLKKKLMRCSWHLVFITELVETELPGHQYLIARLVYITIEFIFQQSLIEKIKLRWLYSSITWNNTSKIERKKEIILKQNKSHMISDNMWDVSLKW
jgi:hypothetical protein